MQTVQTLYETDYADWVADTVRRLKAGDFAGLDMAALIEEVESLGISQRHALSSQWIRVVKHLLKLEAQPQATDYHNSWVSSVVEGLSRLERSLKDSPSLKGYLRSSESEWYAQAVKQASAETRLPQAQFPDSCPYDVVALIDGDYPESLRYFFVIE
ncbi:DUF29 domain-containing protein [Synechococcus sp. PCC 6312]|uniref:DUF29 domain-containing protein n=1 Tax=Synechococcus sp. (strain ATCC 27167 / PCC 6312) TaxID=195253 RepID=UPI00029EF8EF|nr:DUF29 domain-containing protein [Synechococcus sp. PCC 6312]AFY62795.1 protein of unknown function DUF29 [Synechococcus sp. PCC 6312]